MRTLLVGECAPERLFSLNDPDAPTEVEFEYAVAKALACIYSRYFCIVFSGTFIHEGRGFRPDLALIARDFSHWFIIEVELTTHSFKDHVLPQVRAFRYGDPQKDCIDILTRELKIDSKHIVTFLTNIPSTVAVIANKRDPHWESSLAAHDIQFLAVSVFQSPAGALAVEVDGSLHARRESLGFGTYSATDRSLRFTKNIRLPSGRVQFDDPSGGLSWWTVAQSGDATWATKELGTPDIPHNALVQIIRTFDGRLLLQRTQPIRKR